MQIYQYNCTECGEFEAMSNVADRKNMKCLDCGITATQIMTPINFDAKLGLDPDFPTFSSKWAKRHRNAAGVK